MESNKTCPSCGKPIGPDAPQGLCPACLLKVGVGSFSVLPGNATVQTQPFEPPSVADLSRLFPQLEILDLIGQGGMGAVYKARQKDLDRLVALKVLAGRAGLDPGFAERFTREARALARLSHANIVAVYDYGQVQDLHYFIMEYVDGTNLRQIEQAGGLSPRQALAIIPQICEALQFAHDKGIVHRDIKPENILLDREGKVKIADFGLAKILGSVQDLRLTQEGHVMGTPHYMAPEQVEHPQEVDHRADIYSLGVVFYEMLTGELPLGRFAMPSQKVQIDVRLDEVVLRTLEKEPQRRYQHASQVKTEVETIVAHAVDTESRGQESGVSPAARSRRDTFLRWAGRVLGLLGFLSVLVFILAEGFPRFFGQSLDVQLELAGTVEMLIGLLLGWRYPGWGAFLIADGWLIFLVVEKGWPPVPYTGFLIVAGLYTWSWWKGRGQPRPVRSQDQAEINEAEWRDPKNWTGPKWLSLYFSKRDSRVWVPKQIPLLGWTVNLGHPRGLAVLMGLIIVLSLTPAVSLHLFPEALGPAGITVTGTVTDAATGRPINHARVYPARPTRTRLETWTDANGRYELRGWRGEVDGLSAAADGYKTCDANEFSFLAIPSGNPDQDRINLESRRRCLAEVYFRLRSLGTADANAPQQTVGFGPVREVVLNSGKDLKDCFLDLDSGQLLSAPNDMVEKHYQPGAPIQTGKIQEWLRTHGIDLIKWEGPDGLTLVDGAAIMTASAGIQRFETLTSDYVIQSADHVAETTRAGRQPDYPATCSLYTSEDGDTWIFKTREGSAGLLQIRGTTDPRGSACVKIRYKLVRNPQAGQAQPVTIAVEAAVKAIQDYGGFIKRDSQGRVIRVSLVYDVDEHGVRRECTNTSDQIAVVLPAFVDLEELLLQGSQATDFAMRNVGQLWSLKRLWMWGASVSDLGVRRLGNLQQLEYLHLDGAGIGDVSLAVLSGLPRLAGLALQGNRFSDEGLAYLGRMTQLKTLWIGSRDDTITDEGLRSLADLTGLEQLELQNCGITDRGLEHLHGLKGLKKVLLGETKVTEEGRHGLERAIPGLTVVN